jgi:hypothetical protein
MMTTDPAALARAFAKTFSKIVQADDGTWMIVPPSGGRVDGFKTKHEARRFLESQDFLAIVFHKRNEGDAR